jgi:hypothetical protein
MNPDAINTVNVQQFGFTGTYDLEAKALTFDISTLTIFKPGGENNIQGICFQVIDPSGSYVAQIDWTNVAINTSLGQTTYTVVLSGYPSMFGFYKIQGVLREQDGTDYSIIIPPINICKPVDFINGNVPGNMVEVVDCTAPKVGVNDQTAYTYLNKSAITINKNGMFYFPLGTIDPIPFTYTPFIVYGSGNVYTGTYTVRAKVLALYDLGSQIFVQVAYVTNFTFTVNCNSNLCTLLCCMEEMQSIVQTQCNTPAAINAQKKLDQATIPFMMAMTQEKCGKDSSVLVTEVMDILGCDCNCAGDTVEPAPIFTAFSPTVLDGQCGTTATYDSVQGIWVIKSRTITISNAPGSSTALTLGSTTTDCNVAWQILLDPTVLTGEILTTIENSPTYLAIFNSLVQQTALDLSSLGANCIINTSTCDYSLTAIASNPSVIVVNVMINGTFYTAPALSIVNAAGIATWLNALNLGIFIVNYDSTSLKTIISSAANPNVVGTITLSLNGVQQVQQFTRSCGSIVAVLKAIIDYLCALSDDQVVIGRSYTICTLLPNGTIQQTIIAPNGNISIADVIQASTAAFCASLANLAAMGAITCTKIKSVFTDSTSTINTTLDVLYGTRGSTTTVPGPCGAIGWADLARSLFTFMTTTNETDILAAFCATKDRCFTPVCNPVTAATLELIEPCPGIASISGAFTT